MSSDWLGLKAGGCVYGSTLYGSGFDKNEWGRVFFLPVFCHFFATV